MSRRVLLIDLVGLTPNVLKKMPSVSALFQNSGSHSIGLQPPLPAVTCSSQATITTGTLPREHGIVSNGWFLRDSGEVRFWMRSDGLVQGEKIWEAARKANPNLRVANLFWRYCTHADCNITVTERPTYWATGRKSPDVYTSPGDLRNELVQEFGDFPLFRFWGPSTSIESTKWIADATAYVIENKAPDLTMAYLPHLDYELQKFGPNSPQADTSIAEVDGVAGDLIQRARAAGCQVAVLSEYGITAVSRPVYLNRILRGAGMITVQAARNGELLEPPACRAFAACSHQVAHVYVAEPTKDLATVKSLLEKVDGVERVIDAAGIRQAGLDHPRSGELVAIAAADSWFAYPYWLDDADAPDFARCVAIHDKPGHDPAEMFLGPGGKFKAIRRLAQTRMGFRVPFDVISLDASLIRGSHGRLNEDMNDGPMMLADWNFGAAADKLDSTDCLPMTDVKRWLLNHLLE